jgi:hypothetical protein
MRLRSACVGIALAVTTAVGGLAGAGTASAAAPPPFDPPAVVWDCIPGGSDASIASDGAVRGFLTCNGGVGGGPINYFGYRTGSQVFRQATPWTGRVLASAWDGVSATYIVFNDLGVVKIGKRLENGSFSATTTLAVDTGDNTTADVVADNGKWWVVWSRNAGSDPVGPLSLFQEHTLGGTQNNGKISNPPSAGGDWQPQLTWNGSVAHLFWTRSANVAGGSSDIWLAESTNGYWVSSPFATAGTRNTSPSAIDAGGSLRVTWQRDGRINYASRGATYANHSFLSTGSSPKVGYSLGKTFLAWEHDDKLLFTQSSGSGWTSATTAGFPGVPAAVLGQGGKARTLYYEDERLTIARQS